MTINQPYLQTTTIVPPLEEEDTFIQYFNRLYEDIARAVNERDFIYYPIAVSDVPTDIPNIPTYGAYIVCISGTDSQQPVKTVSLVKSDEGIAGVINVLGTQAGTGTTWAGINLTFTSTATHFQVAHNLASTTANFNIRVIGTI